MAGLHAMLFFVIVFLAYTNGANDNFKGVATLFGSGTANYRVAIWWATATTFAGSICAIFMARQLVQNFSGKGLVPDSLSASPQFLVAVGLGAALTVLLATLTGFPISTTHALTGALTGAGLIAVGSAVNFSKLGGSFILPLLASPVIAVVFGGTCYLILHALRQWSGITEETCVCLEDGIAAPVPVGMAAVTLNTPIVVRIDNTANCARRYNGTVAGITCQPLIDGCHFLSAGAVGFARGMNDTPKIVAILFVIQGIDIVHGMLAVAAGMAVGGLLNAKKVGETMSKKITPMNSGQGFTANVATAILVIFASKIGVPVSTTHVSVGSIFGMGLITKNANYKVIGQIALSWVLTLPIAAALSAIVYLLLH